MDGTPNKRGEISHYARGLLTINRRIFPTTLLIAGSGNELIILGLLWLRRINPVIDWKIRTFQFRMKDETYLEFSHGKGRTLIGRLTLKKKAAEEEWAQWKKVATRQLEKLAARKEEKQLAPAQIIFKKEASERFPESRPWDYVIEPKLDFIAKDCRIYLLSSVEQKKLNEFLNESLEKGYIQPSKLPMASPFFFVVKKDSDALRPC
ncbi:hypothetical protein L208DRAFT_1297609, partial [Tricholoma matsutake]